MTIHRLELQREKRETLKQRPLPVRPKGWVRVGVVVGREREEEENQVSYLTAYALVDGGGDH